MAQISQNFHHVKNWTPSFAFSGILPTFLEVTILMNTSQ